MRNPHKRTLDPDLHTMRWGSAALSRQEIGAKLGNWHNGQGDPVYAVGSLLRAEMMPTPHNVSRAANELRRLRRGPTFRKMGDADRKELGDLISALEHWTSLGEHEHDPVECEQCVREAERGA
jgi:hypothetical protein